MNERPQRVLNFHNYTKLEKHTAQNWLGWSFLQFQKWYEEYSSEMLGVLNTLEFRIFRSSEYLGIPNMYHLKYSIHISACAVYTIIY